MEFLKGKGRYAVAAVALVIAFALSVQLGERGVQFDLSSSSVSAEEADEEYRLSSLRIFNRALLQIKENYVEPDRIDPGEMLLAALNAVQEEIPEFVANYERDEDGEALPEEIEIQVVDQTRTFELKAMESLWEMSLRLKEIFMFVEQHLPEDPDRDAEEIEYAAINGMVTTLDPHSGLLTPTHYEEMQTQTGGEFGGLGIVISIQDDELTVISPIDGTPAAEEGIQSQDRITRIGEESTINMNLNEAVNRLRGEPGTEIDIWIDREGWSEPRQFTVERDIIEIESVESEPLADKVGYLRINNFQANTYPDMRSHLDELRETMGGIEGLILDVRGNPGGLLDQSIDISDIFLEEGEIVSTVGVGDTLRETQEASPPDTEPDYPIVVLVNEGSASASEIVAGALQQNERAIVVGDRSFGKGTVQIMYEFPDESALKLTVAQYLTPDGTSLQNTGIVPDLQAMPVMVEAGDVSLFRSELMQRERDIDHALENPSTLPDDDGPLSHIRYLDEEAFDQDQEIEDPNEFEKDFEIELSSNLLREVNDQTEREAMLDVIQDQLQSVFDREMGQIKDELAELDVDWSDGTSPDNPSYDLQLESTANGRIEAGETLELTAALTNRSDEPLYRVKALTEADNPQFRHEEFIFGHVEPDETREWTVEVEIPEDSATRHDRIRFNVSDDDQEYAGDHHYDLSIQGKDRPHYAFTYEIDEDQLADGLLRAGQTVDLKVHVTNRGDVAGDDASVYLKNETGEEVYLEEGRGVVTDLQPGATETVDFQFELQQLPEDADYVEFELDIYDSGFQDFVQREFRLPTTDEQLEIEEVDGIATVDADHALLHLAADADSDAVARASADATLPVVARTDGWLRVELDDRHGWIAADAVDFQEGAAGELTGIEREKVYQKSTVELSPAAMLTDSPTVNLEGLIEDEWTIEDYYIIVRHQESPLEVETRKLDYQTVGTDRLELSTDVDLFEGHNELTVVTRNEAGIETRESVYIYRE